MTDTLSQICEKKRAHVLARKKKVSESELLAACKRAGPTRWFAENIRFRVEKKQPALIAEIKKASPSKGLIRQDFSPPALADAYARGGATCLSVLTDIPYFQGDDAYLAAARAACQLPVLRKDFMLDPYQITESRTLGADCVLLIMAALSNAQAAELHAAARELGMDVLVEVHDEAELARALTHVPSRLLGINNRSLKTLAVDLATSERLAPLMPEGYTRVCESGIGTPADIRRMQASGFHSFLVGESLMRQGDVTAATQSLLG